MWTKYLTIKGVDEGGKVEMQGEVGGEVMEISCLVSVQ